MSEVVAGIIGACAALIVGFLSNIFSGITGRKARYGEIIAKRRVEWIRMMSEHIGIILAEIEAAKRIEKVQTDTDRQTLRVKCAEKYYQSKNLILSQINMTEIEHQRLSILLNEMDAQLEKYDLQKFTALREQLLEVVRLIEKIEWDRTKYEIKD
ncbi:MAG: hypothetical protein LBM78_05045 [Clostridiales bacterium]|jgi:hypothetical protein|nr:hypothetical protein [Clostridiales bacterium]